MNTTLYLLLGAILVWIMIKALKKTTKKNDGYDERQIIIRGEAYKMGFFTMLILAASFMLLSVAFENLINYGYLWNAFSMFMGVTVFAVYSIWNDAYFSLQQNPVRFLVLGLVVTLGNCIGIVECIMGQIELEELIFSYRVINVLCALTFAIISITIMIKIFADRKEEE